MEPRISDNKRLSVVISTGSLSCFISTGEVVQFISLVEYDDTDHLIELINKLTETYAYNDFHVYYENDQFNLIPRNFFLYGDEKVYNRNIYKDSNLDVVFTDHIAEHQLVNIYTANVILDMALRQNYPGVRTEHVISKLMKNFQSSQRNIMIAYFFEKSCIIIMIKDHKIQIVKRFGYIDENDVLYHFNILIQDFAFDGHISLQGLVSHNSKIHKLLNTYIKDVDIYSRDINLNTHAII